MANQQNSEKNLLKSLHFYTVAYLMANSSES